MAPFWGKGLLARFDSIAIKRYGITEREVKRVGQYVRLLQEVLPVTVWDQMQHYGKEYRTSILIHEVVQFRGLARAGINLLRYSRRTLARLLEENADVHVEALYEEHLYLQEVIQRKYGEYFQVATLIKANREDTRDLNVFLESGIGIFLLQSDETVERARQVLRRMKEEKG